MWCCRVLMRHPSCELATLQRRLDVVEFFTRPENDCLMRNICSSLRHIRNVNVSHCHLMHKNIMNMLLLS